MQQDAAVADISMFNLYSNQRVQLIFQQRIMPQEYSRFDSKGDKSVSVTGTW